MAVAGLKRALTRLHLYSMTRFYCLLLAGLLLMAGCTTDEPDPVIVNHGYDYYPLADGRARFGKTGILRDSGGSFSLWEKVPEGRMREWIFRS